MNAQAKTSFIDLFPLFSVLATEDKMMLAERMEHRVVKKYNFVYLPGDASEYIYFLARGTIKIGTHSSDGKEIIKSL
ncbi:MAG TPA: cyclic nucleotide-binding domain-containing protein, partial [Phaeodactylibacter sp.]|nr:cyclic nucleotide-binding domain-containing protein [Phaeodactylibacter sp.]